MEHDMNTLETSRLSNQDGKKREVRSRVLGGMLGVLASLAVASSALATDCVNASKPQASGVQILIDAPTGQIAWTTPGVAERIERGLIDPNTGEGFHGILGVDFDGDGVAEVSTWVGVGPDGAEIPQVAQFNGPACRGLTNIEIYLTECLGS
jgi:hypothetical protein